MSNVNHDVRVLNRMGARELTQEESNQITGGIANTLLSVIITGTAQSPDQRLDE